MDSDGDDFDEATLNQLIEISDAAEKSFNEDGGPGAEHLEVLVKYFGHKNFRPLQWKIISAVIKDHRDVCAVMCTGYGKSICFQYPSTFMGGVTLVISPLISLMEDQVLALKVSNIPACLLGSAQKNQAQVIDKIFNNEYILIYLTPEFCTGDMGRGLLEQMHAKLKITLIAIDEAHCISSWGHDFRHQYRQLGFFRKMMPEVPIMAVTATATSKVRQDIISSLKLRDPLLVMSGFNRPNLYFEVNYKSANGVFRDLSKCMIHSKSGWQFSGSTIIYCITRKQTEEVAEILKVSGIKCRPYHAGLSIKTRQEVYEDFIRDKLDVIVATVAFGMGIDKPDVRNVIHFGAFKSMESYYQEAGRAGRDGLPSNCVVFFSNADFTVLKSLDQLNKVRGQSLKQNHLKIVDDYLNTRQCRRQFILDCFEDKEKLKEPRTNCCDNCTNKLNDRRSDQDKYEGLDDKGCYDFTKDAILFLQTVSVLKPGLGVTTYILFLRGSSSKKIPDNAKKDPLHGAGRHNTEDWWKAIAKLLVQENFLQEQSRKTMQGFSYTTLCLTSKGQSVFLQDNFKLFLPPPTSILRMLKSKPQSGSGHSRPNTQPDSSQPLKIETQIKSSENIELYNKLLDVRRNLAVQYECLPYMVASNTALMKMSQFTPKSIDELRRLNLDGFTEAKILKFGETFLNLINKTSVIETETKPQSINDILIRHPLPDNVPLGLSAEVSCALFRSGLAVDKIASQRGVTTSTIISHLNSGIKLGYCIKMVDLGVTKEILATVVKIFNKHYPSYENVSKLQIKDQCPDVSFEQVGTVLAYLQVRFHLDNLKIPYEEFEDFQFREVMGKDDTNDKLDILLRIANEIKDEDSDDTDVNEPPIKREKTEEKSRETTERSDFDILDSPPRSEENFETAWSSVPIKQTVEAVCVPKNKKSKKVLPPWMSTKKLC